MVIALLKPSNQRGTPLGKVAVAEQATELVNNWLKFEWSRCAVLSSHTDI